jgi:hypothetical protein
LSFGVAEIFSSQERAFSFRSHFAEVTGRTEAARRGKCSVTVRQGKSPSICDLPHLACPMQRAQRIMRSCLNFSRRSRFRVRDIEGYLLRNERNRIDAVCERGWKRKSVHFRHVHEVDSLVRVLSVICLALSGTFTIQKRPLGRVHGLKSCNWVVRPTSQRSIHISTKVPNARADFVYPALLAFAISAPSYSPW